MMVKDVFEESYWYRCLYTFLNWLSDYGICTEMETNTYFSNLELSVTFAISSALLLAQVAIIIVDMAIKMYFFFVLFMLLRCLTESCFLGRPCFPFAVFHFHFCKFSCK